MGGPNAEERPVSQPRGSAGEGKRHIKYGETRSTGFLTKRWVSCYLKRLLGLLLPDSQVIKRARNEIILDSLRESSDEYMKHVIERNASPDRVFNMDETGSLRRASRRR